jgi:hypothetical protein
MKRVVLRVLIVLRVLVGLSGLVVQRVRVVLRVLVVLGVLVVPRVTCAQPREACVSTVPANIQAGLLAQDIVGLLQSSQTFRAQCARIAAARELRIDVELVPTLGGPRGETRITRYQAGALRANVRIVFGQNYHELIAHEFEHVIEQLDGVDLQSEAEHGGAWMIEPQEFETRRASEAGRRVRRECEQSEAHADAAAHALWHGVLRELRARTRYLYAARNVREESMVSSGSD